MKVVRLIKMRLGELHSNVRIDQNLSEVFSIQNSLKPYRHCLSALL